MKRFSYPFVIITLFCLATFLGAIGEEADQERPFLAIMDIKVYGNMPKDLDKKVLANKIRNEAFKQNKYNIMTRENIFIILKKQGINPEDCQEAMSEVEIGKSLSADKVVTGSISHVGEAYDIDLQIYDTDTGDLEGMVSKQCYTCAPENLLNFVAEAAGKLFGPNHVSKDPPFLSNGMEEEVSTHEKRSSVINVISSNEDNRLEKFGGIYITTDPPGAYVYIEDILAGRADPVFQKSGIIPGIYTIRLELPYYHPLILEADLKNGIKKYENQRLLPSFGTLEIRSNPPGADVIISGVKVGVTPFLNEKMPSGRYLLHIKKEDYVPVEDYVLEIGDGEEIRERFELIPDFGSIFVHSYPEGAQIRIDQCDYGITPKDVRLEPGNHRLNLSLDGYYDRTYDIRIARGEKLDIAPEDARLDKKVGGVNVFTDPLERPNARVYLDGMERCDAPCTLEGISPGSHQVEVKAGSMEGIQEVEIIPNRTITVTIRLEEVRTVLIHSGPFWMGCNRGIDSECYENEDHYYEVYLDPYTIDRYEVTVREYIRCVEAGVCKKPGTGDLCNWGVAGKGDHPINCINWYQAGTYCEWSGKRLPTEAEWEKAARGTEGVKYPWGNSPPDKTTANFCDVNCRYKWRDKSVDDGYAATAPVGGFQSGASPYGVMDMAGNVWEWVNDWYEASYYKQGHHKNPKGPGTGFVRVVRGGGWNNNCEYLRTSSRYHYKPSFTHPNVGFRCAAYVSKQR